MKNSTTKNRLESTRSSESADSYRDFDNFDLELELFKARLAVSVNKPVNAAKLYANVDEYCQRSGILPKSWLGPQCMKHQPIPNNKRKAKLKCGLPDIGDWNWARYNTAKYGIWSLFVEEEYTKGYWKWYVEYDKSKVAFGLSKTRLGAKKASEHAARKTWRVFHLIRIEND